MNFAGCGDFLLGECVKNRKSASQSVAGGVAILAFAGVLVKCTALLYKVPLTYLLGDEGMGYFNAAYTIYAWLYMLSTAGLPVAVSILLSSAVSTGDLRQIRQIRAWTFRVLFGIGLVGAALLFLLAEPIARLVGSADAAWSIRFISPTLFFICVASYYRGCFQGFRNMIPTAVSQVIEAIGKVVFGMGAARMAIDRGWGTPLTAGVAIGGVTVGTCLSALYLVVRSHLADWGTDSVPLVRDPQERRKILSHLFSIAIPVTVSASVLSLTSLIDLGLVMRRLRDIGFTMAEATALYGNYTTLVVPMLNLPSVLISPIASGVIPALSAAHATGDREAQGRLLDGTYRITAGIAIPSSVGLCVLARPILAMLYPPASVEAAYRLLSVASPAVYFLAILTVSNAVLQATGHSRVPVFTMLIGGIAKTLAGWFLIGMPDIGILGSPIGTVLCYAIATLGDLVMIDRLNRYAPPATLSVWKPLACAVLSIGGIPWVMMRLSAPVSGIFGTLLTVALCGGVYLILSCLTGVLSRDDLRRFLREKGKRRRAGAGDT